MGFDQFAEFLLQPIANKSSEQIKLFIRANEQLFMPDGQQIGGNLLNGEATTSIAGKTEKWVKVSLCLSSMIANFKDN